MMPAFVRRITLPVIFIEYSKRDPYVRHERQTFFFEDRHCDPDFLRQLGRWNSIRQIDVHSNPFVAASECGAVNLVRHRIPTNGHFSKATRLRAHSLAGALLDQSPRSQCRVAVIRIIVGAVPDPIPGRRAAYHAQDGDFRAGDLRVRGPTATCRDTMGCDKKPSFDRRRQHPTLARGPGLHARALRAAHRYRSGILRPHRARPTKYLHQDDGDAGRQFAGGPC